MRAVSSREKLVTSTSSRCGVRASGPASERGARAPKPGMHRLLAARARVGAHRPLGAGRQVGRRARAARHLVEPAQEALAARAVEERVEPGQSQVAPRGARLVAHHVEAHELPAPRVDPLVQPLREQGRRAARIQGLARGVADLDPRWRSLARLPDPVHRREDAPGPADRRAQDRLHLGHLGQQLRERARIEAGTEPQHQLRQVARPGRAPHLGVEGAQEAVRPREREIRRGRSGHGRRPRGSRRSRASPR